MVFGETRLEFEDMAANPLVGLDRSVVNDHICYSATKFAACVTEGQDKLHTLYLLLNFIKDLTKHGLLQIQALVPPLNFINY